MYKLDKKKSLKVLIQNSLNSKFFRSLYFFAPLKSKDVLQNGDLSCAFYVSVILKILGLIENLHTTVSSTVKDLKQFGWYEIKKPKFGAIILWDLKPQGKNMHLGFCLNKNKAVSNSSKLKSPQIHNIHYENRKIKAIYFHNDLK
ncbi:MAG: hypothetical protein ACP5QN_02425 [Minisyncoccia bacterium]